MSSSADLPDDIELLKALLVEARSLLAERDVEIEQLKAQIDKLRRMQFGRKSAQLQRQIETLETQLENLAAGRGVVDVQRAQALGANASTSDTTIDEAPSRQALPAHLPRQDHVLAPESTRPDCSGIQGHSYDLAQTGLRVRHPRLEICRPPALIPAIGDCGA
jgi:transposase